MIDKLRNHPLKPITNGAFTAKTALAALFSASVLVQPALAAETQWWFDVEVILFERNLHVSDITEKFQQSRLVPPDNGYLDLLTPYLHPDLSYLRAGLDYCRASSRQAVTTQHELDFALPTPEVAEKDPSAPPLEEQKLDKIAASDQNLALSAKTNDATNFQYEVATTDIFDQSTEHNVITEPSKHENTTQLHSQPGNGVNLEQPANLEFTETRVIRPPIRVDFIEWQIPSDLPCAYSEEIDASFASINYLQQAELDEQAKNLISQVPVVIDGIEWPQKRSASVLPKSNMRMNDLYEKIKKQRDISPILHMNWRQQVHFGRENGQTIRLFAGQNYAPQFNALGLPLVPDSETLINTLEQQTDEVYIPQQELALLSPEQQRALLDNENGSETTITEDLFAKIDKALTDETPIDFEHNDDKTKQIIHKADSALLKELWQLDGGITVYLRRVGRVPYLHIDSNLDYRQPVYDPKKALKTSELASNMAVQGAITDNQLQQPNYLQSVNFNQLRRVISKQVHYFDHPLFGMIVRITRYRWPETDQDSDEQESE
ncbi:CsiV family protein [uncultured Paraglaciecola sp.]|uniref:CsiV family protein n=1 Tax=uncultured Paraglaciecola sp. TaxID=1765024 RepID=UPI0030DB6BE5|tara:strand:+ start:23575 stop:25218 length:1644 start_codon:yes stop_codon:yes gene_type:complete